MFLVNQAKLFVAEAAPAARRYFWALIYGGIGIVALWMFRVFPRDTFYNALPIWLSITALASSTVAWFYYSNLIKQITKLSRDLTLYREDINLVSRRFESIEKNQILVDAILDIQKADEISRIIDTDTKIASDAIEKATKFASMLTKDPDCKARERFFESAREARMAIKGLDEHVRKPSGSSIELSPTVDARRLLSSLPNEPQFPDDTTRTAFREMHLRNDAFQRALNEFRREINVAKGRAVGILRSKSDSHPIVDGRKS